MKSKSNAQFRKVIFIGQGFVILFQFCYARLSFIFWLCRRKFHTTTVSFSQGILSLTSTLCRINDE
jgi:hypothetical protein